MRVVLDTNVLVSALLWRGSTSDIFEFARSGVITLCVSRDTMDELLDVLNRPKFTRVFASIGKTPQALVEEFWEVAEYVPGERFPIDVVAEDPKDDKFLSCALAARASFIVSGDRHLLELGSFDGIPIVAPTEFLTKIGGSHES
ncbi:MAG: putative toxin-antitoxin system toxin component, PIN family [Parcubacteria group bacterium]|nr:putative toxin-antitoxin system toxin component, PIN family [Parcubacteria group bacterium]